ncbi:hypothetical protein HDU86_003515 [Geranomyces michiganensis]|nr:hypothetical protein HDU86_003515 [Geranomyces michiganensis]
MAGPNFLATIITTIIIITITIIITIVITIIHLSTTINSSTTTTTRMQSQQMHTSGLTSALDAMAVEERPHKLAAQLLREGLAATPEEDLLVVVAEAVPAATMETGEEEETTLAEWEIRRRSLRNVGVHFARKLARHKASAEDIAALCAILAAPGEDWSATIADMAGRIGEHEAEVVRRVAAAMARRAAGVQPMEF